VTRPAGAVGLLRSADGKVMHSADPADILSCLADRESLVWMDLTVQGEADSAFLRDVFNFHPLAVEDVITPRVDPAKIDDHSDYIFVVVQAVTSYTDHQVHTSEVDFFLGANYVVSCHIDPVPAIDAFRERCERDELILKHTADWLLHGLLDALVDEYLPIVDALDETIDEIEEQVIARPEPPLLQEIMVVKRNTMRLRRATIPQRDILNRLSREGEFHDLIRGEVRIYFRDVYDHLVRIEYLVEALRDLADGALQTYLSSVSNRLNEVMKVLTAAATVFLPLTLISGIYGMNFTHNQFPSFSSEWGFAVVVLSMALIAVALLAYFRLRRWV
jgi:magnesium transporter